MRPPRSTRRARRAGPAPRCPPNSSTLTNAARSESSSAAPRTSSAPACATRPSGSSCSNPRSPASEPRRWDDPTPCTPTATSPTSAATSCSSAPATTPTAGSGTYRTPRPAPPDSIIIDVYAAAGTRRTDVTALKRPMLRALGAVQPQRPRAPAHLLPVQRAVHRRRLGVPRRVRRPHDALGRHHRQHRRLVPRPRHPPEFSPGLAEATP